MTESTDWNGGRSNNPDWYDNLTAVLGLTRT